MLISFIWHARWNINDYPFPFGYLCPFVDGYTYYDNGKIKLNYINPLKYFLEGNL
jgi:hypothetical protein